MLPDHGTQCPRGRQPEANGRRPLEAPEGVDRKDGRPERSEGNAHFVIIVTYFILMLYFTLIPALLSLAYLAIILFLFLGLRRLSTPPSPSASHNLKFSIVIAAHNEEHTIEKCLKSILSQTIDSSRYEVLLVNDRSSDATSSVASGIAERYTNLSVINVNQTPHGKSPKKHAVGLGIAATHNEIIVFTDADCIVPPTWLETIDKYFNEDTGLVQGITVYEYLPGMNRLFFGLQAADFLSHGVVAAAAIGAGLPLNSNANSFAFRKKAFTDAQGYGSQSAVVSGDDDLLLQRIWRTGRWRVRYMTDRAGKVTTLPTPTVRGVFEQRKRWGSKTVHYNPGQVGLLSTVFLFYVMVAVAFVAGFFSPVFFALFGAMLLVKMLGETALMIPGARLFGEQRLAKFVAPASLLQLPMVLCAVVLGVFGRFAWKEQRFGRLSR
jgi:cellulose synthase/poly-beta-1,6-N-acetylglucosamine synthase-like glycosyltransferase